MKDGLSKLLVLYVYFPPVHAILGIVLHTRNSGSTLLWLLIMTYLVKAEEVPTALLLAHAAFLSVKKGAIRRSALWYMRAADKLEKSGIVSGSFSILA